MKKYIWWLAVVPFIVGGAFGLYPQVGEETGLNIQLYSLLIGGISFIHLLMGFMAWRRPGMEFRVKAFIVRREDRFIVKLFKLAGYLFIVVALADIVIATVDGEYLTILWHLLLIVFGAFFPTWYSCLIENDGR